MAGCNESEIEQAIGSPQKCLAGAEFLFSFTRQSAKIPHGRTREKTMKKLGIGVIGVGEMGRQHAENMRRQVPEAQLIAIADVSAQRVKQVADELEVEHAYTSIEEMLQRKDIDAVVISTPDKFHAAGIKAAAAAGRDILCEKPLALTLEDAHAAMQEVRRAGVRLQVGFMRRYDPAYAGAMKRVEAGEIGTPVVFKSIGRDKDAPPMAAYQSGVNGMLFFSNSIHDFDLARWLMQDEVTEVHSYTTTTIRPEVAKFGDIVAGVVNIKFAQGAIGNIDSNVQALYGYDVRTEIVGSRGSIFVGRVEGAATTFFTPAGSSAVLADHFLSRFADAYLIEARDFVHTILSGKAPRITGEDGLRALEIAVAAEQSGKTGQSCKVGRQAAAV
jgi:scyllo-inositol 2-dehydrogenase (NAD+)